MPATDPLDVDVRSLELLDDPRAPIMRERLQGIRERDLSLQGEMKTVLTEQGYPLRENYPNRGAYRKAVAEWRRSKK